MAYEFLTLRISANSEEKELREYTNIYGRMELKVPIQGDSEEKQ